MHFTTLISFLSLSLVVAALPANIPRESTLLARVDAASDKIDPKRDHLEYQVYTAPSSSLIGQKITKIYSGGETVYAIADNYLVDFTWHKEFQESNASPADSKKTVSYSEGSVIRTGTETTLKVGITAEYKGVGLQFGAETKTFTQAEQSTLKTVSTEITLAKQETTIYYQRRYHYRSHVWFLSKQGSKQKVIYGHYATMSSDPKDIYVGSPSPMALDANFTSEILSEDRAILIAPLQGTTTLQDLKTYQRPAQYNLQKLKTERQYKEVESGGQSAILNYITALL